MKLKKLFVLPLLAITLASCELIPLSTSTPDENITSTSLDDTSTSGSEDSGDSTSTDISTPSGDSGSDGSSEPGSGVDPDGNFRDTDLLVLNALLDFAQTDFNELASLDLFVGFDADFALGRYEFLEDDDFLTTIVDLEGSAGLSSTLKIADFDTEDPKMAAGVDFDVSVDVGEEEELVEGEGELALYYYDEWMYGYSDVTLNDAFRDLLPLGMPDSEQKLKQKVGAPDGLGEFAPLEISDLPVEDILEMMMYATDVDVAPDGDGKLITYSIDFDFVIDLAIAMFGDDLDPDLSSEEIDDLTLRFEELVDELFDFERADLFIFLDGDDALTGFGLDLDVALIIPEGDEVLTAEEFDYTEYQRTEIALDFQLEVMFAVNGDVTVGYPSDLSEYVEGVIIPN